jgi:ABC-2 type transport system ATP-binding protein
LSVLDVSQLVKSYGPNRAVDGLSFEIAAGEVFGLLGPNGAGKSTTINIIAGLLRPDDGQVSLGNAEAGHVARLGEASYKRRIGYVPQETCLADRMTGRENLWFVGRLYDLNGPALHGQIDDLLAAVGLADRGDDLVGTYSGGMKRRLNIAAALLHQPDLVLLDEPTAGVDPQARAYIFDIVERLAASGRAILYTTHYMEEAQRLCHRTAIIDHGRVLAQGTLAELTRHSATRRDLVVCAPGLTPAHVAELARRLGDVPWSLDEDTGHLAVRDAGQTIATAARAADELNIHPTSISLREPNLETVFLELTGRALRE